MAEFVGRHICCRQRDPPSLQAAVSSLSMYSLLHVGRTRLPYPCNPPGLTFSPVHARLETPPFISSAFDSVDLSLDLQLLLQLAQR